MSELELLKMGVECGTSTIICLATIKWLGTRIDNLAEKIDECISKMDKRLEKVESAIEHLQRNN